MLLRHIAAYAELAGLDLAKAHREFRLRLLAAAMVGVAAFFALLMGCLLLVACTWDTPYRVAAIAWVGGGFLAIAAICALYRSKVARAQTPVFAAVRREWQEDRLILERLLSAEQD
ncbi:MAG: phage holin family protein [Pseudomonadota bacterium]|nr:phage holin family protein [Pseudomonadota bacterium]